MPGAPAFVAARARIVVADSDVAMRNLVAHALESVGAEVLLATTAAEAAQRMAEPGVAVVLAADRPDFSGASLIRMPEPAAAIRILLTTDPGLDSGPHGDRVVRFVMEPFEPRNLQAVVREALRRHRSEMETLRATSLVDAQVGRLQNRQKLLDAVVIERTKEIEQAYGKLKEASREAIQALAQAIEARDMYTKGHSARVARYSVALARETRYPEHEIETLEFAAFLHDVGKIGVRDSVLLKAGPLDEEEWKHMRTHPVVGYEIAVKLEIMRPLVSCIRNHHERWDGKGYPDGLAGDQIPLIARIVAIADAFDAMATDRPYKAALTLDESIAAFRKQRGVMYDPQLSELFIERVIGELKLA